jgi:hypothetical protein
LLSWVFGPLGLSIQISWNLASFPQAPPLTLLDRLLLTK